MKKKVNKIVVTCPTCKGTGGGAVVRGHVFPCNTCGGQGYFTKEEIDKENEED